MRRIAWIALVSLAFVGCDLESAAGGAPVLGSPAVLEILGGNDQVGKVGAKLPAAVIVRVTDSRKDAVVGVSVTYEVILGEGTLSATTVKTASDGSAAVEWTLGQDVGGQQIEARVVDPRTSQVVLSARINATATAR